MLDRKPYARVAAGLVAEAQTNPEFAELYREHFVQLTSTNLLAADTLELVSMKP